MLCWHSGVHRMRPNQCVLPYHPPQCSGRAHQRTHQLTRPRLWLSMMGLMIVWWFWQEVRFLGCSSGLLTSINISFRKGRLPYHLPRCWRFQGVLSQQQDPGRAESGLVVMAVMMVVMMMNIHFEAQDKCINDSSTSAARVMVKYEEVDGGGVVVLASWSKSCQKVEKLSKSPKSLKGLKNKICKGHWFGKTFTKAPIFRQLDTKNSSFRYSSLTVFRALFC